MSKIVLNTSTLATGKVFQKVTKPTLDEFTSDIEFTLTGKDFANTYKSSNGQQFIEFSLDPININQSQSMLRFKDSMSTPVYAEAELSISQRVKGSSFTFEMTDNDVVLDAPNEFTIVAISQATTTLSVTLNGKFDGFIGSWVDIYGLVDSRFNYPNLCVATISNEGTLLTFTVSDETTIQSLTATPASITGGKLKRQTKLMSASNAAGIRFSGTSMSSFAPMVRFNAGSIKSFGTLTSSQLVNSASTATRFLSGSQGYVELVGTSRFKIDVDGEQVSFLDGLIDTTNSTETLRALASSIRPDNTKNYYLRFRGNTSVSMTNPVAKIKTITKTGTTTATIVTTTAHGLVTGNQVSVYGVRDQAGFPALSAFSCTVIDSVTLTVTIGSAATVSSYGGFVGVVNGGVTQTGLTVASVQTATRSASGLVTLVNTSTWTGLNGIGELVNLYGCVDSAGNDLLLDGVYRVYSYTTTTLILEPVIDANGVAVKDASGSNVTPTGAAISTTNCGGYVLLRSTMRIHDIITGDYQRQTTSIIGQGTNRLDLAVPVILATSPSVNCVSPTVSPTSGAGGLLVNPANTGVLDITSAAVTTTTTSSAFANSLGNGFLINLAVTAVTGTSPTMDVRIEESFDGGTNWVTLYEMQRITAVGSYNSPIMRATGRHIRYVRTITGTSPSFTMAANRVILPFIQAEPQKRLMDRTIVLTTLSSVTPVLFAGAANNVQLVVNLGAATTAPVLQIEGSEDGINFYSIGGTLQTVASSTVQLTVTGLSATYVRVRVSTAGTTVTPGYVSLKAWS